jgi:hypothetical protein
MADGRGGYRQPRDPAPVSGPGRLSRRTDGGPQQTTQPMTGMGYGENAEFNAMQGGAPLAATPSVSNARARSTSPTGQGGAAAVPLFSPTGFPEEPITAGASFGPGDGPGSPMRPMMMPSREPDMLESLAKVAPYDRTGRIASIVQYLSMNR